MYQRYCARDSYAEKDLGKDTDEKAQANPNVAHDPHAKCIIICKKDMIA